MPQQSLYIVDAFADQLFRGNPAGVVIRDQWLAEELMQAIAMENNQAETAFACRRGDGTYDLRWFTPTVEAGFCGHATMATAHILMTEQGLAGPLRFHTLAGVLVVTSPQKGQYQLNLPRRDPEPAPHLPQIVRDLYGARAVTMFSRADNFYVILPSEDEVRNEVPDLMKLGNIGQFGVVISAPGKDRFDFVSRYFDPGHGIPEDPVTGSIHATLTPYWAEQLGKTDFLACQASPRGGVLHCQLCGDRVLVSGSAVTYLKGEIALPL